MMKMTIRAVGNGALCSSGDILAELDVKHEIGNVDQDVLRTKLDSVRGTACAGSCGLL